ncbi:nuclear transport factor 2 family protein [Streptomyces sp. JNUCC 64]
MSPTRNLGAAGAPEGPRRPDGSRPDAPTPAERARRERDEVERVHAGYYEALENGDFGALSDLWLDERDLAGPAPVITCVHPGWPLLSGRGEVLRSYALILANTSYIQFFLTDVEVSVHGGTALVTCTENILSGGPDPDGDGPGPLVGELAVATNLFLRTPQGWRLWSHHASPVLAEGGGGADGAPDEDGDPAGEPGGSPA